jgi:hypothetical protein
MKNLEKKYLGYWTKDEIAEMTEEYASEFKARADERSSERLKFSRFA